MSSTERAGQWSCRDWPSRAVATAGLLAFVGYVFRDVLANCVHRWTTEPQYSHGFIIPLMGFFAISAAAVIISRRTRWEKLLILFIAIPNALVSNIFRIVAAAVAQHDAGGEAADLIFHDLSSWLMMPAAVVLLFVELTILDWLFVEAPETRPELTFHKMSGASSVQ